MNKRQISTLGLTVLLLGGAGVGWRPLAARLASADREAPSFRAPTELSLRAPRSTAARIEQIGSFPSGIASSRSIPADLSAEASAVMAEVAELQLLAQGSDLVLEPHQWEAMAAVTLEIQAVRHAYEATIATGTVLGAGRYRVEIPIYAAAGDALRARLRSELCDRLGEIETEEILTQLGTRLEGRFGGFGVSAQTLDITGNPAVANPDWVLTRTVKFWNSVEGQDRLTTRRETFLPGLEDPSGASWGPLLSVVSQQMKTETGS